MSRTLVLAALFLCAMGFRARPACASNAGRAVPAAPPDSICTYARCALAVVPAWNGLDVVRGEQEQRVTRLGFFWTRDLSPMFAGQPQALEFAKRAVTTRRTAAVFTDAGLALLAGALVGGLADPDHASTYRSVAIGGAFTFAIGVPLQFSADGHLSRAVWWYNTQFAR
ncbi:MAG TPA: hypothetical protein VMJ70_14500 [Candidatus Sulfotelmatobacter sp.]|nr:hypothetical protein [Candidatus Sulfotelmatobacter sp.]